MVSKKEEKLVILADIFCYSEDENELVHSPDKPGIQNNNIIELIP